LDFVNFSVDGQVSCFYLFMLCFLSMKTSAWTTAAVDNERVIAAVPIVMDILNLQKVIHQLNSTLILIFLFLF